MVTSEPLVSDKWAVESILNAGVSHFREFFEGLLEKEQEVVSANIDYTAKNGPHKRKFRHLGHGLFELKPTKQIRIFGFFQPGNRIILTDGYIKKKGKADLAEIAKARLLMAQYHAQNL